MSRHLYTPGDLSRSEIEALFARADEIANGAPASVSGKRIALALFNPTSPLPIQADAVLRAAGAEPIVISIRSAQIADIVREISAANAGIAVVSHPDAGAAEAIAAKVSATVLNAGDGANENPVRALMDAYAIRMLKGPDSTVRTAILGNVKFSGEAHSLARVLGMFNTRISLVTPAALSMPYDVTDEVRLNAYEVEETNDLLTTLRKTDVLYLSNIDSVRVEKKIYDKYKSFYALTPDTFAEAKEGLVILGDWDGATALLAPTRPQVEKAAGAILLALVEG